jgi:anaerobic magnesium-protoporphyrin IX monomethyl ester cyclase
MWRILSLIPNCCVNLKDDTPLFSVTPSTTSGYTSYDQDDLNIRAFDYYTEPVVVAASAQKLLSAGPRNLETCHRFGATEDGIMALSEQIGNAKALLRGLTGDFCDFEEYRLAYATVDQALELVSTAHGPSRLNLTTYVTPYSAESSRQIVQACQDDQSNLFSRFLHDYVSRELAPNPPSLVGISIASLPQVIPTFTLLRFLREYLPEAKVVIGGVVPSHIADKMARNTELCRFFDFLIAGEGETPLWRLAEAVLQNKPVDSIPNLIFWDGSQLRRSEHTMVENMAALPTPTYEGLSLSRYFSPAPVIPVEPARGCYYRKCMFCNQYTLHGHTHRLRPPDMFIEDIKILSKQCNTNLFDFVNEGIQPAHLLRLCDAIVQGGLDIRWYAGARLERQFDQSACERLRAAGCTKLLFGLETASQRLANSMRKGIVVEAAIDILHACTRAGIGVHLYLMVGYPGETDADLETTKWSMMEYLRHVDRSNFTFCTSIYTPMVATPAVEESRDYCTKGPEYDLEYLFLVPDAYGTEGMRQERARILTEAIYARLPDQLLPEEITHYLIYSAVVQQKRRNKPSELKLSMKRSNHDYEATKTDKQLSSVGSAPIGDERGMVGYGASGTDIERATADSTQSNRGIGNSRDGCPSEAWAGPPESMSK